MTHCRTTLSLLRDYESELIKKEATIALNGRNLTIPLLYMVANKTRTVDVTIDESSVQEMETNSAYLQKNLQEGRIIYGANTGYGGSADVRSNDLKEVQKSLIRHLNAGFGDKMAPEVVRGTMLVRANSLALGYSGVRPCIPRMILELLNRDVIPQVPKRGSISASGDLMPTSYIAACMMGREDAPVWMKGVETTASAALQQASLDPIEFEAKEALATVNAASVASSLGACILFEANVAILMTQAATAMSVEVMCGRTQSFHPTIHRCMPHPGQQEVAANILNLLTNSKFVTQDTGYNDNPTALKQDRYALRTSPQWLGPVLETAKEAMRRINVEINSANDNPLIDHRNQEILHCGNFQGTSTTVAMDQIRQGLQLCGKLLFAQMSEIVNCKLNDGLPPNLSGCDVHADFGLKGMDVAMTSYMSELDYLTNTITNHVLSAEMHNQGVNSLALISARLTEEALKILQMMLTNILYAQLQAIELRWLQKKVEQQLGKFFAKYIINPKIVPRSEWPWYNFVFSPKATALALTETGVLNGTNRELFVKDLVQQMDQFKAYLNSDERMAKVADDLGDGTKKLYLYLRRTLDIPSNRGQCAPDTSLEKMFKIIKSRDMDGLMKDMFETQ